MRRLSRSAWQWLFAHTFQAHLDLSLRGLLFLTAWLIYLADRFADTIKLPQPVRFPFAIAFAGNT